LSFFSFVNLLARTIACIHQFAVSGWARFIHPPSRRRPPKKQKKNGSILLKSQRPSASPLVWILCVCFVVSFYQTQKQTLLKKWELVYVMALRDGQWFTRVFPPVCYCCRCVWLFLLSYDAHPHAQHSWLNLDSSSIIHYWMIHHSTQEKSELERESFGRYTINNEWKHLKKTWWCTLEGTFFINLYLLYLIYSLHFLWYIRHFFYLLALLTAEYRGTLTPTFGGFLLLLM